MNQQIFLLLLSYWLFSIAVMVWGAYSAYQDMTNWGLKRENKEVAEFMRQFLARLWSEAMKGMNGYSRANILVMLIPISFLVIISPPLIFPFEGIGFLITIPNKLKRLKKKREDEKIKFDFNIFNYAIELMDNEYFKDDFKNAFKVVEEDKAIIEQHHSAGMFCRNAFALWDATKSINKFFTLNGITHPDEMSSMLLKAFHRKLNHIPYSVPQMIEEYNKNYNDNPSPSDVMYIPVEDVIKN